ncbi:MAG: hypothetical protein H7X89_00160 [Rhizobiales bacterium]|nr:hypothetical protein [Hyphomicrobiales bacterium]
MNRVSSTILILVASFAMTGCSDSGTEWHRKLTVVVDTPAGEVAGSSVQKEYISEKGGYWFSLEASGANFRQTGEATVIDLGSGRYLFALMGKNPNTFVVILPGEAPLEVAEKLASLREVRDVPPDQHPLFVTFMDIKDPKSAKEVDPLNIAATFGAGYNLKSITLEITDEALTEGKVGNVLGWVHSLAGSIGKDMDLPYNHLLRQINDGSFIQR